MNKDSYSRLFSILKDDSSSRSDRIVMNVMEKIAYERNKKSKAHFIYGVIAFVSASAGIVPAVNFMISEFSNSGFGSYFSLIFSDATVLVKYWSDFSALLLESLPIAGIFLLFVPVFLFIFSIKQFAQSGKKTVAHYA